MELTGLFLSYSNYLVVALLFATAIAVIRCNGYIAAVVTMNVFSLLSAFEYSLLGAPDVSITEAAINSCFSCVLLLCAGYLNKFNYPKTGKRIGLLSGICMLMSFVSVCIMISSMPNFGDVFSPINSAGRIYTSMTARLMGFPNTVTAVLAGFRGFDTLWETVVIFTAGVAVFAILRRDDARTR